MERKQARERWDEWSVIASLLPRGWETQARSLGAFRRARGIGDAATLLRVLLVHLANGCSLMETSLRVRQAGWCDVSAVAVFKRLKASESWLRWMAEQLWRRRPMAVLDDKRRWRAVDATIVRESGKTGSQWRIHYSLDLANLQCVHFELTDVKGGETFRRIPVRRGDVMMGDRAYGTPPGVGHVVQHKGDVLVRINPRMMPLFTAQGKKMVLLSRLRRLHAGQISEWAAFVQVKGGPIAGRLIAIKRSREAARRVRARLEALERSRQRSLSKSALETAGYVLIWTTLPRTQLSARHALEVYRLRWQIELAIKRMKSIMGLGQLPKRVDASSRAWLHGKLLVAMLVERLIEEAETLSPWGYPLTESPQSVAGDAVYVP